MGLCASYFGRNYGQSGGWHDSPRAGSFFLTIFLETVSRRQMLNRFKSGRGGVLRCGGGASVRLGVQQAGGTSHGFVYHRRLKQDSYLLSEARDDRLTLLLFSFPFLASVVPRRKKKYSFFTWKKITFAIFTEMMK